MNVGETVLYIKDNRGVLREWAISCEDGEIVIRYGQEGGSMQYQTEEVPEGKATRTLEEQIMSRMASRISKQRDRGYTPWREEALNATRPTNQLGLPKPMLAHKIANVKNINYEGAVTQPKFDGNRCLIYNEGGVNKAYSRNGKPIEAIDHILQEIKIPEWVIMDGELYAHGYPLQTIVSWIKRKQPNTALLRYHWYDVVARDLTYNERSALIGSLPTGDAVSPVYGDPISSYEDVLTNFRRYREEGYEGAILRWGDSGYEDGKRSKSLVKIKEWHDDEFLILDIIPSREGWGILVCELQDKTGTFRVSAPGDMVQKKWALQNKERFIGRHVTVEYANLTADGIPFHPVAINYRDEIQ